MALLALVPLGFVVTYTVLIGPAESLLMARVSATSSRAPLNTELFLRPVFSEGKTTLYEVVYP